MKTPLKNFLISIVFTVTISLVSVATTFPLPALGQSIPTLPDGTGGQIRILSGTGAFASVSDANDVLNVSPGAALNGTVQLSVLNLAPAANNAVAPLIYTPSWGEHSNSWRQINPWVPTGQSQQQAPISLTAPTTPGTYHIIFAVSWEVGGDHVASGTSWGIGKDLGYGWVNNYDIWNDGNDIADFNAAQLSSAQSNGWAYFNVLNSVSPMKYSQRPIPADAITLVVSPSGSSTTTSTSSGSGLEIIEQPTPNFPTSPNLYQFLVFPPNASASLTQAHADSEITTTATQPSLGAWVSYPIYTGIATECQPFTITIKVKNIGTQSLLSSQLPKLNGSSVTGTSDGLILQPAPNATFNAAIQNPPASIDVGQTSTLTYLVTADWKVFDPPSSPITLSSTAQNSSDAASKVITAIEFLSETFGKSGGVLSKEGSFLEGVDDVIAASDFIGSKIYVAQYYSFRLQSDSYSISDSYSQYENVSVIMQPYKADVMAAYYTGFFSTFTGFPGFAQWLSQWTAPVGVSKIMNNYPVLANLCWYEKAFDGCLLFSNSSQPLSFTLLAPSFSCATSQTTTPSAPLVQSVDLSQETVVDNQTFQVTVTVKNTGQSAGNFDVQLVDTALLGGWQIVAPVPPPTDLNFSAGQTQAFTFDVTATSAGTHSFKGQARINGHWLWDGSSLQSANVVAGPVGPTTPSGLNSP
jgi:hypothetical protein